jgi:hypothetical protein
VGVQIVQQGSDGHKEEGESSVRTQCFQIMWRTKSAAASLPSSHLESLHLAVNLSSRGSEFRYDRAITTHNALTPAHTHTRIAHLMLLDKVDKGGLMVM